MMSADRLGVWGDTGMGMLKSGFAFVVSCSLWGCVSNYDFEETKISPQTLVCTTPVPVIGDVQPKEVWHWTGWKGGAADYKITYSSPVAGDLLGDGKVKVVTVPSTSNYTSINGPIVVLDAATGNVEWNSMDSPNPFGFIVSSTPAILDLDGDGVAEIIGISFQVPGGKQSIDIVDYREKKVQSSFSDGFLCGAYCMVAVADIDGDGKAEIVAGNTVLNSDGTLKFRLPITQYFRTTTIAKLIPSSPGLQIIVGSQVFSSTGQLLWQAAGADSCIGFTAVGDLEQTGSPQLICSGGGSTFVYDFQGTTGKLRWKKPIPRPAGATTGSNNGGAPNIGHFLGNKQMQFGLAGGDYYLVYDAKGNEIWRQQTLDHSSSSTGSTLFDLNGDGKVEVLYNDEQAFRIYDGATGEVLWSVANPSGTLWEYPLVVDVDADHSADIIISAPNLGGIRLFTDPSKKWVNTRNLWNQYSYFPEIVGDSLQAVANPKTPAEGFRVNTQGSLPTGEPVCR